MVNEPFVFEPLRFDCIWISFLDTTIWFLCWGLTTRQPVWVNLCGLPEKERKIEKIVEEMKVRDREERGTGMKVKKQKK